MTFHVPEDFYSEAWYAWWVGEESGLLRREAMVARGHYMLHHFHDFDAPFTIAPQNFTIRSLRANAVLRVEDPTLLTGQGKYVDDLAETGMLHLSFVRSSVAHGTIDNVDIGDAASMPGVAAVYHAGNDLGMPAMQGFPMLPPTFNRPIFASDRVRCVGDIIAAVVAESKAQADDAADAITVDITPLAAVVTAADGIKESAPLLFPEL